MLLDAAGDSVLLVLAQPQDLATESCSLAYRPPRAFPGSFRSGLQLNPGITESFITSPGRGQSPHPPPIPQWGPYFQCDSYFISAAGKQRYFKMSVSAGVSFRLAIAGTVRRRVGSAVQREPINHSRQPLIRQGRPHHHVTERERL